MSQKHNEILTRFSIYEGADLSIFWKIMIFGDLTNVSYTVFYALFHCGNEKLLFDEANDGICPNYIFKKKWNLVINDHLLRPKNSSLPQ